MKLTRLLLGVSALVACTGCSDDNLPPDGAMRDAGVDLPVWLDAAITPDAGPDQVWPDQALSDQALSDQAPPDQPPVDQAPPDQALPDVALPDQAPPDQAPPDQAPPDQAPPDGAVADQAVTDQSKVDQSAADQAVGDALTSATIKGVVKMDSTITCGAVVSTDCKGVLTVLAFNTVSPQPGTTPVAQVSYTGTDLSGGKTQAFELKGIAGGQTVHLAGILTEAGTPPTPAWVTSNDLTNSLLVALPVVGGAIHTTSITFDTRVP